MQVGWIIAAFFTLVSVVASFWLVNMHLKWYNNVSKPPVYALKPGPLQIHRNVNNAVSIGPSILVCGLFKFTTIQISFAFFFWSRSTLSLVSPHTYGGTTLPP